MLLSSITKLLVLKNETEMMRAPDGKILHTMIKIGDTRIMMSDSCDTEEQAAVVNRASMWIYTNDCDAMFNKAVDAGSSVTMKMEDQFWGDRVGQVRDPFGYLWSIASHKWDLTAEEIVQKQNEWFKSSGM